MDNNTSFEITIPPGGSDVPDVPDRQSIQEISGGDNLHPHPWHGSIGRSHEVGIVEAGTIYSSAIWLTLDNIAYPEHW
jgi:hypothetical protein